MYKISYNIYFSCGCDLYWTWFRCKALLLLYHFYHPPKVVMGTHFYGLLWAVCEFEIVSHNNRVWQMILLMCNEVKIKNTMKALNGSCCIHSSVSKMLFTFIYHHHAASQWNWASRCVRFLKKLFIIQWFCFVLHSIVFQIVWNEVEKLSIRKRAVLKMRSHSHNILVNINKTKMDMFVNKLCGCREKPVDKPPMTQKHTTHKFSHTTCICVRNVCQKKDPRLH